METGKENSFFVASFIPYFILTRWMESTYLVIVIHTAKYFKQGFKFNEFNSNQYFDLVFCYWDFSISSDESVVLARVSR